MKICYIVPELYSCGPVNVVLNLIKYLSINNEIMLISLKGNDEEKIVTNFKYYCSLGIHNLKLSSNIVKDLNLLCLNADIIHSHGFYPDKLVKDLKVDGKKISTVHCMFYKDYLKEYGLIKGGVGAFMHFNYLKNDKFNYIVACSKSVQDYLLNNISRNNIVNIKNGVDHQYFKKIDKDEVHRRRKNLSIDGYDKVFIYSGRLIRRKRVPELIEIFNNKYSENNLLIILGDGEDLEECKKKSQGKNVIFFGCVENPSYYYQISDYVLSNSLAEGYPMSILEAVSCGCSAILSDILPHLEFLQNNPEVSFLIGENIALKEARNDDFDIRKLSSERMALEYFELYKR